MKTNNYLSTVVGIILALWSSTLQAGENLWVYAKGTDTRPQGSWELKYNQISRIGKNSGDYSFMIFAQK